MEYKNHILIYVVYQKHFSSYINPQIRCIDFEYRDILVLNIHILLSLHQFHYILDILMHLVKMRYSTDKILDVQPVTYYDRVDYDNSDGDVDLQYGLIAEDMAENEVGTNYVVRAEDGAIESVQYSRLVVPLLSALRHLRKRVDELEAKVNESSS